MPIVMFMLFQLLRTMLCMSKSNCECRGSRVCQGCKHQPRNAKGCRDCSDKDVTAGVWRGTGNTKAGTCPLCR